MYTNDPSLKTAEFSVAKKLSVYRYDRAEILLHELRMLAHGLGERTEDDSDAREPLPERRRDRDAVEDRVNRDPREHLLLVDRDAELVEGRLHLGIHFVQAVQRLLLLRRRVIDDVLVVDRLVLDVLPGGLLHREPQAVSLQPPLQQPVRLLLLFRDQPDDALVETLGDRLRLDVGVKAVLVHRVWRAVRWFQ